MPKARSNSNHKMPLRTAEITFEDVFDGIYGGFTATVRLNVTYGTKADLFSGDRERFERALKAIVVDWDFTDPDGAPITPGDPYPVPDDLLGILISRWGDAVNQATEVAKN